MARRRKRSSWLGILLTVLALVLYVDRRFKLHRLLIGPAPEHGEWDDDNEPVPQPGSCGAERWATKTLTDREADEVDLSHVRDATVEELGSFSAPVWHDRLRRLPQERSVYRVTGDLTEFKLESDGDYHIVLAGDSGQTMIIEIPRPDCTQGSVVSDRIKAVRERFDAMFPNQIRSHERGFHRLRRPRHVVVTGVGFFDKLHHQRGIAPNGFELHPVLSIETD